MKMEEGVGAVSKHGREAAGASPDPEQEGGACCALYPGAKGEGELVVLLVTGGRSRAPPRPLAPRRWAG